jgi:hypothetical protein
VKKKNIDTPPPLGPEGRISSTVLSKKRKNYQRRGKSFKRGEKNVKNIRENREGQKGEKMKISYKGTKKFRQVRGKGNQ